MKQEFITELATKARHTARSSKRIREAIKSDGEPENDISLLMITLRAEMNARIEDWQFAYRHLREHRTEHGC